MAQQSGDDLQFPDYVWVAEGDASSFFLTNVDAGPTRKVVLHTQKMTTGQSQVLGAYTGTAIMGSAYGTFENRSGSSYTCNPAIPIGQAMDEPAILTFTRNASANTNKVAIGNTTSQAYSREIKIFDVKIYYANDQLQFHGIPCYRKSDGAVGLYDTLTEMFFDGVGTRYKE